MKRSSKILIVVAGYVVSFVIAAAVVRVWLAVSSGRDDSSGMAAFGEMLLFLGVFAVSAIPASGAAFYFLRPYRWFWRVISVGALAVAATAIPPLVGYVCRAPAMWAPLRVLAAPLLAMPFFIAALFAPTRRCRIGLLVATAIEAVVFVGVAFIWFLSTR